MNNPGYMIFQRTSTPRNIGVSKVLERRCLVMGSNYEMLCLLYSN